MAVVDVVTVEVLQFQLAEPEAADLVTALSALSSGTPFQQLKESQQAIIRRLEGGLEQGLDLLEAGNSV